MAAPIIGLGVPLSWPYVNADFFDSFTMMYKPGQCHLIRATSGPIEEMRNNIANRAIDMDCSHLLFLDADMVFPTDTIIRLLERDVDIVGGLCYKRWPPFHPTVFKGKPLDMYMVDEWEENELVEVTATGTGCLLINTEVLKTMPPPWFKLDHRPDNGGPIGEDINFCYHAAQYGYKIYVDTSVAVEHLATMWVGRGIYTANKMFSDKFGKNLFNT